MRTVGRKHRAVVLCFARALVDAEQRRPAAALAAFESQKHQHGVAASVVVDVVPVRVADGHHAIGAAAIAAIGQPEAGGVVGRGERELPARGQERLSLSAGYRRPQTRAGGGVDNALGECNRTGQQERGGKRKNNSERVSTMKHEYSPSVGAQGYPALASSPMKRGWRMRPVSRAVSELLPAPRTSSRTSRSTKRNSFY